MSFPRYPSYKESGVDWLGKIPAHWQGIALKRIVRLRSGDSITAERINESDNYPVYGGNGVRGFTASFTHEGEYVVVGRQGALCGNINYANGRFWASEHAVVASPLKRVDTVWLGEMLRAMDLNQYSVSAAQPGLSMEYVGNLRTILPPLEDQIAIAGVLKRETVKVDDLVREQQRLIELLKEQRQAVISCAVTKGLNPDAPMKSSGIEWLGEVPADWEVMPLKHSITKIEQGWSPQCESEPAADDEWGVLKVGCGNGDRFDPSEQKALPSALEPILSYEIQPGDILMSRGNTLELVGAATYIEAVRRRLLLCDLLYRFRARPERAEGPFLVHALRSAYVRFQIQRDATGTSASMKKISQGVIRELIIAVPPVEEQRRIVSEIKRTTAKLDELTNEAQRAIDLLQERRASLISAAVTGKIDVRGLAATEAA